MRDFTSCISEYAVHVSDQTSCSTNSCTSPEFAPSIQNATTCLYRTTLSSQKQILITLTWTKNPSFQSLAINFNEDPSTLFKINTNLRLFRRPKGSKSIDLHPFKIEASWDLSNARYQPGPEPVSGFYLIITVDSEPGLILGDIAPECTSKKVPKLALLSRKEHFSGNALYSTKVRFCDKGSPHDISIRCSGENEHSVLSVSIDKKMVIRVKRLQWNFRGNQTIFLDGLLVDLMWDVHDWLYNGEKSGPAVFLFRTRSGKDSRLWLEEKVVQKDEDNVEFSLMIYATKNT